MPDPIITRIEVHQYEYTLANMGRDYNGFNLVYEPGGEAHGSGHIIRILTDQGVTGEYAGGNAAEFSTLPSFEHYLIGRSALERERIYTDVRRALRQVARIGFAPVDNALWDLAGKLYDAPSLQAARRLQDRTSPATPAPITATTSPTGSPARKPSPTSPNSAWTWATRRSRSTAGAARPSPQEVANVREVGKRVGGKMDLMLDPACEYITFGDAVKVGWACDEYQYLLV